MRISKKLCVALLGILSSIFAAKSPNNSDTILAIGGIASSYILGQSHVDAKQIIGNAIKAGGQAAVNAAASGLAAAQTASPRG